MPLALRRTGVLARAIALLALGVVVGTLAILTHGVAVGLMLGLLASGATAWALPGGWSLRFSFTTGWVAVLGYVLVPRGGGGYLIASDARGYVLLGFGLVLMLFGIVTVRPLRPAPGGPAADPVGESAAGPAAPRP